MTNKDQLTRREFMVYGGAAAGMLGIAGAYLLNERKVDLEAVTRSGETCDVLIIGGGMAGLFAAVKHDAGAKVVLVSKGRVGSSGLTPFAKGMFQFDPENEEMSLDEYVAAVSRSALGTNNPIYTRQTAEHSRARIAELREWGFFESNLYNNTSHRVAEPTSWAEDHVAITGIFAIGGEKSCSLLGDMGSEFWIDEWEYPAIGIYFADCPSGGHDMLCLDYRECGPTDEPQVVHVDQEYDFKITVVAKSFEAFIRGLESEENFE